MSNEVTKVVREKYGETARSGLSSSDKSVHAVAEAFGYTAEELAAIPAEANMGLSCGNPTALASLKPGEVVVDLGSGGGLDVFLAAQRVGPEGRAIGVDMTPDMISLAERNAQKGPGGKPYSNVEFKLGQIDDLPLDNSSADVIISNCVINLAPDKNTVFAEMFRVLKPGGRVAVSDIALKKTLPKELKENVAALTGCIAGAIPIEDYTAGLREAGFDGVTVIDDQRDLTAYGQVEGQSGCCTPSPEAESASSCCAPAPETESESSCCTPAPETDSASSCCTPAKPMHAELGDLFARYDINDYAASVKVFAIKT